MLKFRFPGTVSAEEAVSEMQGFSEFDFSKTIYSDLLWIPSDCQLCLHESQICCGGQQDFLNENVPSTAK